MDIIVNIISAVLKLVVADKVENKLVNEVIGISIDEISEKGIHEINDFINREKIKIEHIFSRENMRTMNISDKNIDYVIMEIKELFNKIEVTNEIFRLYQYDRKKLSTFFWNEYCNYKGGNSYVECEKDIKQGFYLVAKILLELLNECERYQQNFLVQISNSIDEIGVEKKKVDDYLRINFEQLNFSNQIQLDMLKALLEEVKRKNDGKNEGNIYNEKKQNKVKQEYIETWNSRLFLHLDNDVRPITLKEAFIFPDYKIHKATIRIEFEENDMLDETIKKFLKYQKTSSLLILGVPGIGKSSITSWIADKYKNNDNVIILRFRCWTKQELEEGLLDAICNFLDYKRKELEDKILILDGFDEIKFSINSDILPRFLNDILDFRNLKIVITSRLGYLVPMDFENVIEILPFEVLKIQRFYYIINGVELDENKINTYSKDVLGIPVILYMAIMCNLDLTLKTTKPELYDRVFSEKGGIFDKFTWNGIGYDNGTQPLRDKNNIKKYLRFLQDIAFKMFEKNKLILSKDEFEVPEMKFQGVSIAILEFPIKYLFEYSEGNIEFIHTSIYEYFVSEYIFFLVSENISESKVDLAGAFGKGLNNVVLSNEIISFLKYRMLKNIEKKFDTIYETFQLMMSNGMTFFTNNSYKDVVQHEMNVFVNMLEIIHFFELTDIKLIYKGIDYIKYNKHYGLNLLKFDLSGSELSGVYLKGANLQETNLIRANLSGANLEKTNMKGAELMYINLARANLVEAHMESVHLSNSDLSGADLSGADLSGANLTGAILTRANLSGANLSGANLSGAHLVRANLEGADLSGATVVGVSALGVNLNGVKIFENQFVHFEKMSNIQKVRICDRQNIS